MLSIGLFQTDNCSLSYKTSFIHNWAPLIEDFVSVFYKHDLRKVLFVYFIFLHSGFWKVKFVPFILPPKVRNDQNFWWGKIYPVLISLLMKLQQSSLSYTSSFLVYTLTLVKAKTTSVLNFCLLLFASTFFEFAVLAQLIIISDSCFDNFLWAFVAVFGWVRFFPLYFRYQGSDRRTCCFLTASAWEIKS